MTTIRDVFKYSNRGEDGRRTGKKMVFEGSSLNVGLLTESYRRSERVRYTIRSHLNVSDVCHNGG